MSRLLALATVGVVAFLCVPGPVKVAWPETPNEVIETIEPEDLPEIEEEPEDLSLGPDWLDQLAQNAAIEADQLGPPPVMELPLGGELADAPSTESVAAPAFAHRIYPSRYPRRNQRVGLTGRGDNEASARAVAMALAWLARQQKADGGWEFDQGDRVDRVSATAFAILPYLAVGEAHKHRRNRVKDYSRCIAAGLGFLMRNCAASGPSAGRMSPNMQTQSLATLALVEDYAMTKDAIIKPYAQFAIDYLQKAQGPNGGWGEVRGAYGDIFVTGWAIQALYAAQLSEELAVDERVIKRAVKFLDSIAAGTSKSMYGVATNKDARPGTTPTAIGLLCRDCINSWGPNHPGLIDGVAGFVENRPSEKNRDPLYVYYATCVLWAKQGEEWVEWNAGAQQADGRRRGGVRDLLVNLQSKADGRTHGSWEPEGAFGERYGRLGTTAMSVLTLEVYYRHLPIAKDGADGKGDKIPKAK